MSKQYRLPSLLIAFHLVAVTLAAIPDPAERGAIGPPRTQHSGIHGTLTASLDRSAALLARAEAVFLSSVNPVKSLTQPYVDSGLPQGWSMFSEPWTDDQYVRIDHYIGNGRGQMTRRQLVLPAQREDEVRLSHAFRDKAINRTVEAYLMAVGDESSEAAQAALPVAQSRIAALLRHARSGLPDPDDPDGPAVVRSEVWYGRALIPEPGKRVDPPLHSSRLAILNGYRDLTPRPATGTQAGLWTRVREADITWQLIYIEAR